MVTFFVNHDAGKDIRHAADQLCEPIVHPEQGDGWTPVAMLEASLGNPEFSHGPQGRVPTEYLGACNTGRKDHHAVMEVFGCGLFILKCF